MNLTRKLYQRELKIIRPWLELGGDSVREIPWAIYYAHEVINRLTSTASNKPWGQSPGINGGANLQREVEKKLVLLREGIAVSIPGFY